MLIGQAFIPQGHSATETHRKLMTTLGKEALSESTVHKRCKRSKIGNYSVRMDEIRVKGERDLNERTHLCNPKDFSENRN